MNEYRLAVVCLMAVALAGGAATCVCADIITYDFEAYIDGRDLLVVKDNTLQWQHLNNAAVGRHEGRNEPTVISSSLNGVPIMENVAWIPEWSSPPPDEIRNKESSSVFQGLDPPLPRVVAMTVSLRITEARSILEIYQLPWADNDYTLILDFNDNSVGGAAWYKGGVTIEYTPIPEPSTVVMWSLLAFMAVGCGRARTRRF